MSQSKNPVFCALDTIDTGKALAWAKAVAPYVGGLKIGIEFFNANGRPLGVAVVNVHAAGGTAMMRAAAEAAAGAGATCLSRPDSRPGISGGTPGPPQ